MQACVGKKEEEELGEGIYSPTCMVTKCNGIQEGKGWGQRSQGREEVKKE